MAAAGTPLLTVMDISQVIARAHIPQPEAALLKVGDKATVTVPGQEDPIEGKITVVSPALDPNSTTVEVWVQAENPRAASEAGHQRAGFHAGANRAGRAGRSGRGRCSPRRTAPRRSCVSADSRAHQKAVKAGIRQGDEVQIVEGLQAGDQIVASGAYGLPDNTRIKAESPPAARRRRTRTDKERKAR